MSFCFAFSSPSETNLKISGELGWMGMEEETKSEDAGKKGTEAERPKRKKPFPLPVSGSNRGLLPMCVPINRYFIPVVLAVFLVLYESGGTRLDWNGEKMAVTLELDIVACHVTLVSGVKGGVKKT